jgi:hypothetical protein
MSAYLCRKCGQLLRPHYGDGDNLCAACIEAPRFNLPATIEPKPGEDWQPVRGSVGSVGFGTKGGR